MIRHKTVHVDGFTVLQGTRAPIPEEIAVVDACRYQPGLAGSRTGQGKAGHPLLERKQRVHRPVPAFAENAERDMMGQGLVDLQKGFPVARDFPQAVPAAYQREDPQEPQDPGGRPRPEDIGPSAEDGRILAALQNHQGVHQGIRMIRGNDDRPVGRKGPG